jgi:hypothetical protein
MGIVFGETYMTPWSADGNRGPNALSQAIVGNTIAVQNDRRLVVGERVITLVTRASAGQLAASRLDYYQRPQCDDAAYRCERAFTLFDIRGRRHELAKQAQLLDGLHAVAQELLTASRIGVAILCVVIHESDNTFNRDDQASRSLPAPATSR